MNATIVWEPRTAIWFALREDGEKQSELAERAGIDPSKLSRILNGETKKLDIFVLKRIAEAQGRPLEYYTDPPIIHVIRWFRRPIDAFGNMPKLKAA